MTLTLEVGIYKWYTIHCSVMMHVSIKFHKIIFIRLEVVVRTRKGIFDILPLLVNLTLEEGTNNLVMMHVAMKFHEIIFIPLDGGVRTKERHL